MGGQRTHQTGFTLLIMTLLLATAGGLMLVQQHDRTTTSGTVDRALSARRALSDARTALLAYTADYARLYGHTGAGHGHLPCPDTDGSDVSGREGPNPPCGRGLWTSGALPRHVTPDRWRYAFHDEPDRTIRYSVSTAYVNNPLNRLVNARGARPTGRPDLQQDHDQDVQKEARAVAALAIAVPRGLATATPTRESRMIIHESELLRAARSAVLRWLIGRANAHLVQACAGDGVCVGTQGTCDRRSIETVSGEPFARWLSDPGTGFIDAVPASRHWFVRNRWYEDILVHVSRACRHAFVAASIRPGVDCPSEGAGSEIGVTGTHGPSGAAKTRVRQKVDASSCTFRPVSPDGALPMVIALMVSR